MEITTTLALRSMTVTAHEIANALALSPDSVRVRGARVRATSGRRNRFHAWEIQDVRVGDGDDVAASVRSLFERLRGQRPSLEKIREAGVEVAVSVCVDDFSDNISFVLPELLIREASELGASVFLDVYLAEGEASDDG